MLKRNNRILLLFFLTVMSFIVLYAGHFLLDRGEAVGKSGTETAKPVGPPVRYTHISTKIKGKLQEINILEVNPGDRSVEIKPALSYESIFGFEKLSDIARRNKAYAAVNAGFFYQYGNPSGLVMRDGQILALSKGKFPVLMMGDGKAEIRMWNPAVWVSCGEAKVRIDQINPYRAKTGISLFTPEYGNDNRVDTKNFTVVLQKNKVLSAGRYSGKVKIPKDGMLLTFYNPTDADVKRLSFTIGSDVQLTYDSVPASRMDAYECGSWLIRGGQVVVGDKDPWVGVMTNQDPRTMVGIKKDGQVVLLTVDGRQPGYSAGMTGKELGEFALGYGIVDAALLDGGASTEMIVEGKVINRPSGSGQERPVGGGLIVKWKDES